MWESEGDVGVRVICRENEGGVVEEWERSESGMREE